MDLLKAHNLVTFNVAGSGTRIFLKLEGDFVWSAGLMPNVNRAVIPFTEWAKLQEKVGEPGWVEFWFNSEPRPGGVADHTIKGIRIVDLEPVAVGEAKVMGGKSALRIVELRLYMADARERFVAPRGGWLLKGEINPADLGAFSDKLRDNQLLIGDCLGAMGITTPVPAATATVPALRGLQWNGTPATPELAKLLEHCRAVFVPRSDETFQVEMIGEGDEFQGAPGFGELPEVRLPGLGRRGKKVVITSAPTPVVETVTLNGPSEATWEFVVQDESDRTAGRDGKWVEIHQCKKFGVTGPLTSVKTRFAIMPDKWRGQMDAQAYRFIRLSKKFRDPKLSQMFNQAVKEIDGNWGPVEMEAKCFILDPDGKTFSQPADYVHVQIEDKREDVDSDHASILRVRPRLLKLSRTAQVGLENFYFEEMVDGDLRVRFSFPASADGKKEYFATGFVKEVNGLRKMEPAELKVALDKPDKDTVFINRKDLQLYRVDGKELNKARLEEAAKVIATAYLAGSHEDFRIKSFSGFMKAELSGKVSEIRWSQGELKTTVKINSWAYPLTSFSDAQFFKETGFAAFKGQAQSTQDRMRMGGEGARQAVVPIMPSSGEAASAESIGTLQGQHHWMVADNEAGWEFPMLHPIPVGVEVEA